MPQKIVSDTFTHMTLHTINGVVCTYIGRNGDIG